MEFKNLELDEDVTKLFISTKFDLDLMKKIDNTITSFNYYLIATDRPMVYCKIGLETLAKIMVDDMKDVFEKTDKKAENIIFPHLGIDIRLYDEYLKFIDIGKKIIELSKHPY